MRIDAIVAFEHASFAKGVLYSRSAAGIRKSWGSIVSKHGKVAEVCST